MKEDLRLFLPKADLERLMYLLSKTDPSFFLLYLPFNSSSFNSVTRIGFTFVAFGSLVFL